jgi:hypothetical protein
LRHKIASLLAIILLANLIAITTAFSSNNTKYDYHHIQSASAAPLISPSAPTSNNIVNTKSVYEITFTTASPSTMKTVEIIFSPGTTVNGVQLIERSGIGPGIISTVNGPNGPLLTYTISSPVTVAAGIPIRLELANIVNANTAGNTVISITTKDTNGAVIDGPTNSVAYPIRQIASGDIADNAITTNKIANGAVSPDKISQNNVYTAWASGDIYLKPSKRMYVYDGFIDVSNDAGREPAIAVSGNNVYVVWRDISGGNNEILFRRINIVDGGTSDSSVNLSKDSSVSGEPAIVVSGNNVYVVWADNTEALPADLIGDRRGTNADIVFRKSMDGGNTFGSTVRLSVNAGDSREPAIAVSGNNVYVVWSDNTPERTGVLFRKSIDSGSNFGSTVNLSNNAGAVYPSLAVSGNNVYVVWNSNIEKSQILFRKSIDSGSNFGSTVNLSNNAGAVYPSLAVSGNNVYVVWQDGNEIREKNGISLRKSIDSGSNFGSTVNLSNNAGVADKPAIAVSGNNIYVVWTPYYVLFRSSTNGGGTFTIAIILGGGDEAVIAVS